jgi:putative OPT family oligopeptide transporter
MALIQPAASSAEEIVPPLAIPPDQVAEMDEAEWYRRAYQGDDVSQLTVRAVLMGSVLGFFLAYTNLYIGLKTGWHLGVAITACILSYAIWNGVHKAGLAKTPMSILENNCMQSTASAAGYSTGGTMVSAIAALLILSATPENPGGTHLPVMVLVGWTLFLAVLGVVIAIPMKRNMINQERLKFPSGLAAAVTLQSLYASGSEAARKAKALLYASLFGAAFPPLIDLELLKGEGGRHPLLPASLNIFDWIPAVGTAHDGKVMKPSDWTITWDVNPVMIAAGMLVGLRVALWMTIGGLFLAYVAGPIGLEAAWKNPSGDTVYAVSKGVKAWKEIGLWLGAPMMVSAGLMSFAFQWRTILRAFKSLGGGGGSGDAEHEAIVAKTEVPFSWFAVGVLVSGSGVIFIAHQYFEVPILLGVLAVVLTLALALVAARATGESDITPTGAMGKIMQLTYGVLIPQSATANLMTAGITAGAASSCADLLNDLKSGYLLGANPRRQFIAQGMGIASGTLATVTGFYLLVPDATALTGVGDAPPKFPAPAAQAWRAVAEVFRDGISSMHPMHQQAIFVGLVVGVLLVLGERFLPKGKWWVPSATGLGLGFILPFQYPLSMLVGAAIAEVWKKKWAQHATDYLVPVSAGVIAGVSIIGVIVAIVNNVVLPAVLGG